jgi:hypothetical protein
VKFCDERIAVQQPLNEDFLDLRQSVFGMMNVYDQSISCLRLVKESAPDIREEFLAVDTGKVVTVLQEETLKGFTSSRNVRLRALDLRGTLRIVALAHDPLKVIPVGSGYIPRWYDSSVSII